MRKGRGASQTRMLPPSQSEASATPCVLYVTLRRCESRQRRRASNQATVDTSCILYVTLRSNVNVDKLRTDVYGPAPSPPDAPLPPPPPGPRPVRPLNAIPRPRRRCWGTYSHSSCRVLQLWHSGRAPLHRSLRPAQTFNHAPRDQRKVCTSTKVTCNRRLSGAPRLPRAPLGINRVSSRLSHLVRWP